MNDLARPAMYGAWHDIDAVGAERRAQRVPIVGPICETGDTFAMDREMDTLEAAIWPYSVPPALMARRWHQLQHSAVSWPKCWSMATDMRWSPTGMPPADDHGRRARAGMAEIERVIRSLPLLHRIAGQPRRGASAMVRWAEAKARLVETCGRHSLRRARGASREAGVHCFGGRQGRGSRSDAAARQGLLVNVADRPDLCDFTTPSILDRDPVLVAIGTSGASAGLAKQLRLRLERILPPRLGLLAARLEDMRDAITDCATRRPRSPARPRHSAG